jgi:hypothetical protein
LAAPISCSTNACSSAVHTTSTIRRCKLNVADELNHGRLASNNKKGTRINDQNRLHPPTPRAAEQGRQVQAEKSEPRHRCRTPHSHTAAGVASHLLRVPQRRFGLHCSVHQSAACRIGQRGDEATEITKKANDPHGRPSSPLLPLPICATRLVRRGWKGWVGECAREADDV